MDPERNLKSSVTSRRGTPYRPTESFYLTRFRSASLESERSYFLGQALQKGNGQSYHSSDSINETDSRLRPLSSDLVLTTSSEGVQEQGPQSWKLPLSVFYLREGGRNRCVMLRRMRAASLTLHWNRCSPCSRVVCKYLSQIALGRRKLMQEG